MNNPLIRSNQKDKVGKRLRKLICRTSVALCQIWRMLNFNNAFVLAVIV